MSPTMNGCFAYCVDITAVSAEDVVLVIAVYIVVMSNKLSRTLD